MKPFGKLLNVSSDFKIRLPKTLLKLLSIRPGSYIHISVRDNESLIIRKATAYCIVTGKLSDDYDIFFNKLVISREGQEILLRELNEQTKNF